MYALNLSEEEIKNKVAYDFFKSFDCTQRIDNIDFMVLPQNCKTPQQYLLWAEAKKGNKANIVQSLIQLILTIGKAKIHNKSIPPLFLGAFDGEKMAFLPYHTISAVFNLNDFNWNVTPSDYSTKEFMQLEKTIGSILNQEKLLFYFLKDKQELKEFITKNFVFNDSVLNKIQITKINFIHIYQKWRKVVMPSILIDWKMAKQKGILDGDFYLADCLSLENKTITDKLLVLLKESHYELLKRIDETGLLNYSQAAFLDKQQAHFEFWKIYARPPAEEVRNFMIKRRDLLVSDDIRERKGAFFTPQMWVEKAQEYLAKALGENWQEHYYVWDCAAGTGNLLAGLTEARRIFASTLDKADVDIMHERIDNGANLLPGNVFQFDFLNDDFEKLPQNLQKIIKNEPEKLVIFINPPYAEAPSKKTVTGTGKNKAKVALGNKIGEKYKDILGKASNELFAQFFIRIYKEIPNCVLASFSTLKYVNSANFIQFRETFKAKFLKGFMVPAYTFDNVNGKFPIGFLIWDLKEKE